MSFRPVFVIMTSVLAAAAGCAPEPAPQDRTSASGPAASPQAADGEWIVLFDGTDLAAWNPIGDANWQIADGAVRADAGNGFLVSAETFEDFDLSLEFWATPDANSGIFFRCMSPEEISDTSCYEANIYDRRPDPTYRTGGIVNVASPMRELNAGGRWNSYEITADGSSLSVTLNGTLVVEVEDERLASGPIALQYGAGTVMFRDVRLRPR